MTKWHTVFDPDATGFDFGHLCVFGQIRAGKSVSSVLPPGASPRSYEVPAWRTIELPASESNVIPFAPNARMLPRPDAEKRDDG